MYPSQSYSAHFILEGAEMARWYICTDYSSILNPIPACMHNPSYQHIMRGYTPHVLFENLDSSAHNGTIATTAKNMRVFL